MTTCIFSSPRKNLITRMQMMRQLTEATRTKVRNLMLNLRGDLKVS